MLTLRLSWNALSLRFRSVVLLLHYDDPTGIGIPRLLAASDIGVQTTVISLVVQWRARTNNAWPLPSNK